MLLGSCLCVCVLGCSRWCWNLKLVCLVAQFCRRGLDQFYAFCDPFLVTSSFARIGWLEVSVSPRYALIVYCPKWSFSVQVYIGNWIITGPDLFHTSRRVGRESLLVRELGGGEGINPLCRWWESNPCDRWNLQYMKLLDWTDKIYICVAISFFVAVSFVGHMKYPDSWSGFCWQTWNQPFGYTCIHSGLSSTVMTFR